MGDDHAITDWSTLRWRIVGRVQGVGFRPFVYRLAHALGLRGWVQNLGGEVELVAGGTAEALRRFETAVLQQAPPLARPRVAAREVYNEPLPAGFEIRDSTHAGAQGAHLPPDQFTCPDCLHELDDPTDRRYRYPFINCTQCGPRYTLIRRLPYDRPNTTMAHFALCPACRREYEDPLDRRFHAQPLACLVCGPQLRYRGQSGGEAALAAALGDLRAGRIVAVKGIGGYHLLCDACNRHAVTRLRARKHRPHKPLAVMFPWFGTDGLDAVRAELKVDAATAEWLADPVRPIVLLGKADTGRLADEIAPGLDEIGAMLPYSPLHHLLLRGFGSPLVATSGNLSGEPVLTDEAEADARLAPIADAFLHHNRPIERPADDPVYRLIAGRLRPLRLGRGNAPIELDLLSRLPESVLAVGGHLKNTVALAWDNRAVLSPHIGELDSPRSVAVFEQVIADLQRLYGIKAERVACDAHPGYASTRWARRQTLPVTPIYHHHAHASALAGEYGRRDELLVFTWDGTGYGADGILWGGEALYGRPGTWQRVASFRPFFLPGGDKAGREPWRAALALAWELGLDWRGAPAEAELLRHVWVHRINCPQSSAVGRLFDAAAAVCGLSPRTSFEGQAAMELEAISHGAAEPVALPISESDGVWTSDWAPLYARMLDHRIPASQRGAQFHASLAIALAEQAVVVRDKYRFDTVGLCGGVFQNRLLTQAAQAALETRGFAVLIPERLPCNDAAISFGQIIQIAAGLRNQ